MEYIEFGDPYTKIKTYPRGHVISKANRPESYIKKIDYVNENFDIFLERRAVFNIITIGEIVFDEAENINLQEILGFEDLTDIFIKYVRPATPDEYPSLEVRKKIWSWESDGDLVKRLYNSHFPEKS